ncbi:hypothetical protein [Paraburkholderia bannensis]|uniref:hypothetical protein n=1 Tax=Paraburkholderia bannensis TaxID=765414 RepID=UPI002AB1007F|nr:hypothetical protein [Paraburkholderia bannensis]
MSGEIYSGIFGGLIAPLFSKVLGKFKLWKVFVFSLALIYLSLYIFGAYFVGFKESFFEMSEYLRPKGILIFFGIAAAVTLAAFIGRDAIQKDDDKVDDGEIAQERKQRTERNDAQRD